MGMFFREEVIDVTLKRYYYPKFWVTISESHLCIRLLVDENSVPHFKVGLVWNATVDELTLQAVKMGGGEVLGVPITIFTEKLDLRAIEGSADFFFRDYDPRTRVKISIYFMDTKGKNLVAEHLRNHKPPRYQRLEVYLKDLLREGKSVFGAVYSLVVDESFQSNDKLRLALYYNITMRVDGKGSSTIIRLTLYAQEAHRRTMRTNLVWRRMKADTVAMIVAYMTGTVAIFAIGAAVFRKLQSPLPLIVGGSLSVDPILEEDNSSALDNDLVPSRAPGEVDSREKNIQPNPEQTNLLDNNYSIGGRDADKRLCVKDKSASKPRCGTSFERDIHQEYILNRQNGGMYECKRKHGFSCAIETYKGNEDVLCVTVASRPWKFELWLYASNSLFEQVSNIVRDLDNIIGTTKPATLNYICVLDGKFKVASASHNIWISEYSEDTHEVVMGENEKWKIKLLAKHAECAVYEATCQIPCERKSYLITGMREKFIETRRGGLFELKSTSKAYDDAISTIQSASKNHISRILSGIAQPQPIEGDGDCLFSALSKSKILLIDTDDHGDCVFSQTEDTRGFEFTRENALAHFQASKEAQRVDILIQWWNEYDNGNDKNILNKAYMLLCHEDELKKKRFIEFMNAIENHSHADLISILGDCVYDEKIFDHEHHDHYRRLCTLFVMIMKKNAKSLGTIAFGGSPFISLFIDMYKINIVTLHTDSAKFMMSEDASDMYIVLKHENKHYDAVTYESVKSATSM
jgi:hypothetical protein